MQRFDNARGVYFTVSPPTKLYSIIEECEKYTTSIQVKIKKKELYECHPRSATIARK